MLALMYHLWRGYAPVMMMQTIDFWQLLAGPTAGS
jgi:hypothetical protein